jgi:hypothetical protein
LQIKGECGDMRPAARIRAASIFRSASILIKCNIPAAKSNR